MIDEREIRESLEGRHNKFLDEVGEIPYKVSADSNWKLNEVSSKIRLILYFLSEAYIISSWKITDESDYMLFELKKEGLGTRVQIYTDGNDIVMIQSGYEYEVDRIAPTKQWYSPTKGSWDWNDFSKNLLDFIHWSMYKSQTSEKIIQEYKQQNQGESV